MLPYLILLVICILFALFDKNGKYSKIPFLLILFMTAFRGENVGTDTIGYLNNLFRADKFIDFTSGNFSLNSALNYLEISTNGVYYIIQLLNISSRWIIIFFSVVTLYFLYLISKKSKINLSVLLLFYLISSLFIYSLNIARQIAAVVVIGYATLFLFDEKKSYRFFIWIVAATTIHATSIAFSIIYIFRKVHFSKCMSYMLISIVFFLSVAGLLNVGGFLSSLSLGSYSMTYGDNLLEGGGSLSFKGIIANVLYLIIDFIILSKIDSKYITLFSVSIMASYFAIGFESVIARMFLPFTMIYVYITTLYFQFGTRAEKQKTLLFYFLILLRSYSFISSISGNPEILPYYMSF